MHAPHRTALLLLSVAVLLSAQACTATLEKENQQLKADVKALNSTVEQVRWEAADVKTDLEKRLGESNKSLRLAREEARHHAARIKALSAQVAALKAKNAHDAAEIARLRAENAKLKKLVAELRARPTPKGAPKPGVKGGAPKTK